jgi:murein DD-endopeptidase MepM/ murein hydrolase activator NlpD
VPVPVQADATDLSRLRARSLDIPVTGIGAAQLNDNYTQARAGGAEHEALDIMAPRGTPVLAVEDGRIAKLFLSKPGGITLYQFDPSNEYAYYYAHLNSYADGIAEGGKLRKGQVIGYVGSSGNASPDAPHLHFAIFKLGTEKQWWRGTPINPFGVWRDTNP